MRLYKLPWSRQVVACAVTAAYCLVQAHEGVSTRHTRLQCLSPRLLTVVSEQGRTFDTCALLHFVDVLRQSKTFNHSHVELTTSLSTVLT